MRRSLPPEPRNIWAEYRRVFGEGPPVVAFGSRGTPARVERWMREAIRTGKRLTPHRIWKRLGMTPPPRDADW